MPNSDIRQNSQNVRLHYSPRLLLDFVTFTKLRELMSQEPSRSTAHSRFACYLALYLPEVAAYIDEDDFGIIHLEIAALARATADAVARNDWPAVRKYFSFISDMQVSVGGELHDAINVSFAKYLAQDDADLNTPENREQLPLHLQNMLDKLEALLDKQ